MHCSCITIQIILYIVHWICACYAQKADKSHPPYETNHHYYYAYAKYPANQHLSNNSFENVNPIVFNVEQTLRMIVSSNEHVDYIFKGISFAEIQLSYPTSATDTVIDKQLNKNDQQLIALIKRKTDAKITQKWTSFICSIEDVVFANIFTKFGRLHVSCIQNSSFLFENTWTGNNRLSVKLSQFNNEHDQHFTTTVADITQTTAYHCSCDEDMTAVNNNPPLRRTTVDTFRDDYSWLSLYHANHTSIVLSYVGSYEAECACRVKQRRRRKPNSHEAPIVEEKGIAVYNFYPQSVAAGSTKQEYIFAYGEGFNRSAKVSCHFGDEVIPGEFRSSTLLACPVPYRPPGDVQLRLCHGDQFFPMGDGTVNRVSFYRPCSTVGCNSIGGICFQGKCYCNEQYQGVACDQFKVLTSFPIYLCDPRKLTATEGVPYQADVCVSVKNLKITWKLIQGPANMTIHPVTGRITWSYPVGAMAPIKIVVGARTADMASFLASTLIVLLSYEPYIVKVVRNDTATVSIVGQTNYVAIPSRAPFSVPVRMIVFKDRQPYYEWQVWTDGNGHFETVYIENYQDYGVFSVLAIHPGKTLLLNAYSPYFTDPRVSWCVYYVQLIGPSKVTNCNVNQQCRAEIVIKTTPTHELTNFTLAISNDQTATVPELINAPSIMHIPKKSVLSIPLVFVFREPLEGNVKLVARADGKSTIAKLDIPFKVMSQNVHVHIKPMSLHFLSCNGMFGNIRNSIQIYNYGLVPITNLELSCADQCPVFISSIVLENQLPEQQSDMLLPGQSACLNFEVSNSKKDFNITTDVHLLHNINLKKDIPLIIVSLPEPCWTLNVVVYSFEVFASDAMLKTATDTVIEVKNLQLQYDDVQEAKSGGNQFSLPAPAEYMVQVSKLGYDVLRQVVSVRFAQAEAIFMFRQRSPEILLSRKWNSPDYKFSIEQKNNLILMEPPLFTMNVNEPKTSITVRLKNQAHVTLENIYFDEKNIETVLQIPSTTVVAFLNPRQATAVELKLNFNYTSEEFLFQMQQCNLLCLPLRYEFTVENQFIQMEECFLLQFSQPSVEDPTVCRVQMSQQMPVQIPLTIRNELPCSCGYVAVSECLSLYSTTGSCGKAVEMITSIPGLGMILEMLQLINTCSRSYIDLDLVDRVINCVMSSGYNCLNAENATLTDNNSDIYNQFNVQSISPKKDFFSAYARFFSLMRTILSMPRLYWSDSHWFSMFKKFISETSENEESLSVRELKALSETVGNFQQSYQLNQALKLWNTTATLLKTGKSLPTAPYSFPWNEMILFANLKDALQKLATKLNAKNAFELLDQSLVTLSKSENATIKKSLTACLVGSLSFSTVSMYENEDAAVQLTIQNLNPNKLENVTVKLILMSVGSTDNMDNNVNMQLGNATAFGFDRSNNIGPNDQTAGIFWPIKAIASKRLLGVAKLRATAEVQFQLAGSVFAAEFNSPLLIVRPKIALLINQIVQLTTSPGPSVIIAINNIGYSTVEELRLENPRPLFSGQDSEEQLAKPFVRKALLDQTDLQPQWNQRILNIRPGQVVHVIYFLDPPQQWTFDRFTYDVLVNGNIIPAVESRPFFALHFFHENDHQHQHQYQHQQISAALLTDDNNSSTEVPKYFYIFSNGQLLPVINVQPVTMNYCVQSVDHCLLEANVTGSGAGVLYGRLELPFKLNVNMSLVSATVNQVCTGPWHVWTTDLSSQTTILHFALPNWSGSEVTKLTLVFGLPSREPIYFLHDQYNQTLDRCTPVGSTIFKLLALCVNHSNEVAKVTYSLRDTYGVLSIDPLTAEIKLRRPLTDIGQVNEMSIQVIASSPTQAVPTASTVLHLFIVDNITISHHNFTTTTTVGTVCINEEEPTEQPTITVDQTQLPQPESEVDWTNEETNSTTTDEQEALQSTEYTTKNETETVTNGATTITLSTLLTINPFDNSSSSWQNATTTTTNNTNTTTTTTTVNDEFQSTEFQQPTSTVTVETDSTPDSTNNLKNTTQTIDEQNNETETGLISETLLIVTNTAPTSDLTNSDNQMTLDEIISLACKLRTSKSLWAIICDLGRIKNL
ncbi:hypothetical protein T4B_15268 [Trichinella pseudospiralis]|uniref:EGF-like domain-containing protein n=1 Tax=Trichinella pseudospiralis TaxID=6337 RepID=A0A0V1IUR0_TRIPS|nr:hypothetical protein T4B_15268 [Trichinella pseudospiralis]